MPGRKESRKRRETEKRRIRSKKREATQRKQNKTELSRSERRFYGPGLRRYMDFFSFRNMDIVGKKILDVGSAQGNFQRDAERVGAEVIGVDPIYAIEKSRNKLKKTHRKSAGLVQFLPFRAHSFDITFARRVIPDKVYRKDRYMGIKELLRVTKPGGWVGLGPYLDDPITHKGTAKAIFNLTSFLDIGGYKYESQTMDILVRAKQGEFQIHTYFKIYNTGNLEKLEKHLKKMR